MRAIEVEYTLEEEIARGSEFQERISHIQKTLQEGRLIERATVAGMLDEVEKIVVYPERMELYFELLQELITILAETLNEEAKNV